MESKAKIALFCLIAVNLISSIFADECRSVQVFDVNQENHCVEYVENDNKLASAKFYVCKKGYSCRFDQYNDTSKSKLSPISCEEAKGESRSFPGGVCSSNDNCIDKLECKENRCVGKALGSKCVKHSECAPGNACLGTGDDKKCQTQLGDGATCTEDYECANTHGCVSNKCVKYFSVNTGENAGVDRKYHELSPCTSGKQNEITCIDQVLLTEDDCTGDCRYKIKKTKEEGEELLLNDVCDCRFDTSEKRACYAGTKNPYAIAYVEKAKAALEKLKDCHTLERKLSCNAYNTKVDNDIFTTLTDLYFYKWMKDNSHRAKGLRSEDEKKRLVKVVFTDYASKMEEKNSGPPYQKVTILGRNNTCPKFKCDKNSTKGIDIPCAKVSIEENGTAVVNLYHSCNTDTQYCDVDKFDFTKSSLANGTQFKCTNRSHSAYTGDEFEDKIFPCSTGLKADGKKCKPTTEKCSSSGDCDIGKYCIVSNGTCTNQLDKDKECASSFDCKNNLLCLDRKCKEMFSVEKGHEPKLPDNESDFIKYACKSGTISKDKKTCVELYYKDGAKDPKICYPGQKCEFIEVTGDDTKKGNDIETICECGINDGGNAYCPAPYNYTSIKLQKWQASIKSKANNKCNTKSRFTCKQQGVKSFFDGKSEERNIFDSQYFYKASECAEKVLSSTFVKISSSFLVVLVALLF